LHAQTPDQPSRAVTDPGVITTRQAITPAGVSSIFQGRIYGLAWAGEELWALHASSLYRLDWKNNRVLARLPHEGRAGNQSIAADPAGGALIGVGVRGARVSAVRDGKLQPLASGLGRFQPGALAIAAEAGVAAVPLVWENKVAIVD